jgi:hypothetical protein
MMAYYLLSGSPTIGWYSGVVVLDVVRGERLLDELMSGLLRRSVSVRDLEFTVVIFKRLDMNNWSKRGGRAWSQIV